MKEISKITVNLVMICAAAGVILSATWALTDPVRIYKEDQEREAALKGLIPSATSIKSVKDVKIAGKEGAIYKAVSGDQTIGYIVLSYGKGYSSFIKMLVAVGPDMKVTGIDILGHAETPGLGDQVGTPEFKDRFKGKGVDNLVVVKSETMKDIQAISGATISSRGVTRGVKEAVEILKSEMNKGQL